MHLPFSTPSHAAPSAIPESPWSLLFWYILVALLAGFGAVILSDGAMLDLPFVGAILYTVALGTLLHFFNSRGTPLWNWTIAFPLGGIFLLWLPPFGLMFLLTTSTSFFFLRALDWEEEKAWILPLLFYGASILTALVYRG